MIVDYGQFKEKQNALLNEEEEAQKEFIRKFSAGCKEDFRSIFKDWNLPFNDSYKTPSAPWCEGEFKHFPWNKGLRQHVEDLKVFQRSELSMPPTWFGIHVQLVEAGIIDRSFLAHYSSKEKGAANIRAALKSRKPEKRRKKGSKEGDADLLDKCLRHIFRHMGGIVARYSKTVYLDCSTSTMFWRMQFLDEVKRNFKKRNFKDLDIYACLCESSVWRTLVETAVGEKTAMSESHIRSAFLVQMMQMKKELDQVASDEKRKLVKRIIDNICQKHLRQYVGYLDSEDRLDLISKCTESAKNG